VTEVDVEVELLFQEIRHVAEQIILGEPAPEWCRIPFTANADAVPSGW
jgi:hypothetical protein